MRSALSVRGLAVTAVALALAVVAAPAPLASLWPGGGYANLGDLRSALSAGFVGYWAAGDGVVGPGLARPVAYWAHFHLVKALLAAAWLVVLLRLGSRWAAADRASTSPGRRRLPITVVTATVLAVATLLALLVLVANVQGAIAPLSSALGLLPLAAAGPDLAPTVQEVRSGLAEGTSSPALDGLVHDFVVYHAAMAGLAAMVTACLLTSAALAWRRRARSPREEDSLRRLLAAATVAAATLGLLFAVLTAANLSTVAHPAPALLAFFDGGH